MTSNQRDDHGKGLNIPLAAILCYCIIIALSVFSLAAKGDTTLLGDPYYEDTIPAYKRALLPWLLTIANVALSLFLAIGVILHRSKRHREKRRSDT